MKYLVIGLGIYGANLSIDLTRMGHEVIGADINPAIVEGIKDDISTAYILDATDDSALEMLPLTSIDVAIVAIGENFGASVRAVALLKKAGVAHIYARAVDDLHEAILQGFNIDRILTPEQRAARDLVLELGLGERVLSMPVGDDTYVLRFAAPDTLAGLRYTSLDLEGNYGVTLVAAMRATTSTNIVGMTSRQVHRIDLKADPRAEVDPATDTLVCLGTLRAWHAMLDALRS